MVGARRCTKGLRIVAMTDLGGARTVNRSMEGTSAVHVTDGVDHANERLLPSTY